jgi:ATP-dependent exoDNAse (exonuclease V) beta subunit
LSTATGQGAGSLDKAQAASVSVVRLGREEPRRPGGARYGTLVHAILAAVPLDGNEVQVAEAARLQARILGAPAEEMDSAIGLVIEALKHPLFERAQRAWQGGRCRRETPVAMAESDGTLLEGVLDLAFEEEGGWTVIDFKTDRDADRDLQSYRAQVQRYARIVARATGKPANAVILQL